MQYIKQTGYSCYKSKSKKKKSSYICQRNVLEWMAYTIGGLVEIKINASLK